MRGAAHIASQLVDAGVDTVFGVMGEGNLELLSCLTDEHDVRYVAARHETGAVMMAWGYARTTGRTGVATVTHGPGLTNALTAIVAGTRLPESVLVIAGAVSRAHPGHVQALDHAAVLRAAGATVLPVREEDDLAQRCDEAVRGHLGLRVLDVPVDIQEGEVDARPAANGRRSRPAEPPMSDPLVLASAAEVLERAAHPLILIGRGASLPPTVAMLRDLAQRHGALMGTTLQAAGALSGESRNLGIVGGFARPEVKAALSQCDALFAFGASLNPWTMGHGRLFPTATIVHCDRAADAFGRHVQPDIALHGDAEQVAAELLARTSATRLPDGWFVPLEDAALMEPSSGAGLHPRGAARVLDQRLPAERTVVVDAGHFTGFPAGEISVADPAAGVYALGFGSVGLGLGAAVGAAVGRPDRLTVACVGDGGLMMSLPELDTAVRERLRLTVLVFNDRAYGAEVHHLATRRLSRDLARFATPSFADVAVSLGARGQAVMSDDELAAVDLVGDEDRPVVVVDIAVDPTVIADWFVGLVEQAAREAGR